MRDAALGGDVPLSQVLADELLEVFHGPVQAALGQFAAVLGGDGEQAQMRGISRAGHGPGLGPVEDLEKVIGAEHGSADDALLFQLIPQVLHGQGVVVDGAGGLAVEGPQLVRGHDAEVGEKQLAHLLIHGDGPFLVPHLEQRADELGV